MGQQLGDMNEPLLVIDDDDNLYRNNETNEQNSFRSRKHCRNALILLGVMIGIEIVGIILVKRIGVNKDYAAFGSGAALVLVCLVLDTKSIHNHINNWYERRIQSYMVKIILMVPFYAICSWLSLRFYDEAIYFDAVRSFYEAFTVYTFINLVIEIVGGHDSLVSILESKDPSFGEHRGCFKCCLSRWEMGSSFLRNVKWGASLFVIVKACNAILIFVFEPQGKYDDGIDTIMKFPIFVGTLSGMYSLILFYSAVEEDLTSPKDWHPYYKFLCVQGVILATTLQGLFISILVSLDVINDVDSVGWDEDVVAAALQNYIIIFEMCLLSLLQLFAYSYKECLPLNENEVPASPSTAIWDVLSIC